MARSSTGFFGFWQDLDWRIRLAIPLALLCGSGYLLYLGYFFEWGWIVGIILLLVSGRSRSEKHGYRF